MDYVYLDENEIIMKELTRENDWRKISGLNLSEEDLLKYKNKLDWKMVLDCHDFIKINIIEQLIQEGLIDLENKNIKVSLCDHVKMRDIEFIKKYKDKLTFCTIAGHCNFKPQELAQFLTIKPKIGMGATYVRNSYLRSYTVIKVSRAGDKIEIQRDTAELIEGCDYTNQAYNFTPDPNGKILRATLRQNGNWGIVNHSAGILFGCRQYYTNPDNF
jgi:uncharacterized protein (DUF433 family)